MTQTVDPLLAAARMLAETIECPECGAPVDVSCDTPGLPSHKARFDTVAERAERMCAEQDARVGIIDEGVTR